MGWDHKQNETLWVWCSKVFSLVLWFSIFLVSAFLVWSFKVFCRFFQKEDNYDIYIYIVVLGFELFEEMSRSGVGQGWGAYNYLLLQRNLALKRCSSAWKEQNESNLNVLQPPKKKKKNMWFISFSEVFGGCLLGVFQAVGVLNGRCFRFPGRRFPLVARAPAELGHEDAHGLNELREWRASLLFSSLESLESCLFSIFLFGFLFFEVFFCVFFRFLFVLGVSLDG